MQSELELDKFIYIRNILLSKLQSKINDQFHDLQVKLNQSVEIRKSAVNIQMLNNLKNNFVDCKKVIDELDTDIDRMIYINYQLYSIATETEDTLNNQFQDELLDQIEKNRLAIMMSDDDDDDHLQIKDINDHLQIKDINEQIVFIKDINEQIVRSTIDRLKNKDI